MHKILAAAVLACGLVGCATAIDPAAERVSIMTANQKERCATLGIITTDQRLGPNKPASAMNKAINEVARRGGNGIYVVANTMDWAEGATVTAEALNCPGATASVQR